MAFGFRGVLGIVESALGGVDASYQYAGYGGWCRSWSPSYKLIKGVNNRRKAVLKPGRAMPCLALALIIVLQYLDLSTPNAPRAEIVILIRSI